MTSVLSAAGRAFLRAFGAALIVYASAVTLVPDLHKLAALGLAALLAALAAGLRAVTAYVPQLSFATYVPAGVAPYLDSFVHGFLASLLVSVTGIVGSPDLDAWKSLAVAAVIGALTAGTRAVQALLTRGQKPVARLGVPEPKNP